MSDDLDLVAQMMDGAPEPPCPHAGRSVFGRFHPTRGYETRLSEVAADVVVWYFCGHCRNTFFITLDAPVSGDYVKLMDHDDPYDDRRETRWPQSK